MHDTYALDVLKKIKHKASTAEEKEALSVAILKIEKDLAEAKKAS